MQNNSKELPEEYKMAIQRARQYLIDFEIVTNPKYEPNWHHEQIARELQKLESWGDKEYKVLMVFVPPRHGKSQQCSIDFPAWYLGRNPDKEIITVSYSAELAQDFGSKTREIVQSQAYQAIFNIRLKEDEKARAKWRTNKGGSYTSVGVGGAVTGRGANILLFDDPIKNREEAESEIYREKVWQFFTSTAFTRLEPGGVIVVILTRWHVDDLAGRILANKELRHRTKIMHFPAITDGKPLWPERFSLETLEEIKRTIGPYDWEALYQGSPVLTENQEFKPAWFKYKPEEVVQQMNCRRFLTIDTAMSQKTYADYTGFCDNSINQENFWYLRAWRARMGPEELVDNLFSLHEQNRYERIGIEKTAYYEGLKPYLDEEQRKRNKFLPIFELKHNQTQKETRIRGLIPRYASGSIFHIDGRCKDLEQEMFNFPMGDKDDVLDAVAYQLQITAEEARSEIAIHISDYSV